MTKTSNARLLIFISPVINRKLLSAKEYGIAPMTLNRWIKQYSTVEVGDGEILTAKQIKELQQRLAQLEEENLILKKRLPSSRHTRTKIKCYL